MLARLTPKHASMAAARFSRSVQTCLSRGGTRDGIVLAAAMLVLIFSTAGTESGRVLATCLL